MTLLPYPTRDYANAPSAWEDNAKWSEAQALAYAKQQLVKFVKQMDAKDRVAIYSLAQSLTVLSDFTGFRFAELRSAAP